MDKQDEPKRSGRPRKYEGPKQRLKAYRRKQEGRRLDLYIDNSTSWKLSKLAKSWKCSIAAVVERLTMEADERYSNILFPET